MTVFAIESGKKIPVGTGHTYREVPKPELDRAKFVRDFLFPFQKLLPDELLDLRLYNAFRYGAMEFKPAMSRIIFEMSKPGYFDRAPEFWGLVNGFIIALSFYQKKPPELLPIPDQWTGLIK